MVPEQETGGSIERSRRQLSTSAPCPPKTEGEPLKESEVPPSNQEETAQEIVQASQVSPRQCQADPRASAPESAPLTRNPSSDSAISVGAVSAAASPEPTLPSSLHTLPLEPPVTRSTLSELDVSKIIHNPKLRHDINFDPELHFRPNLDGEKGRRKQEKANQFWRTLKQELSEFIIDRPTFIYKHGDSDEWTLPILLKAVKDIIQTLVPQRDRQFLEEGLNVELLMQQFHKGVADLEKLAMWLSRVLKSHCAPMRDEWVDTMYNQLSNGNRNMDLDELVTGMRSLLSVLEAMKLDVANHQIRCLRPVLIEDTTHFEQKFFLKRMESGKTDISMSRQWYKEAEQTYADSRGRPSQSFGDMGVFFDGLSRLMLPSAWDERLPNTFLFDEERLMKLRADVLDAINLEVCMRVYEDFEKIGRRCSPAAPSSGCPSHVEDIMDRFDFNTPPSISRPSSVVHSAAGSATSSPRSSFVLPSYVAPKQDTQTKARELFHTLVALLQTSPPASQPSARWQMMAPSMALQIFRFVNLPSTALPELEARLASALGDVDSSYYRDVEESFHTRLMADLGLRVREFKGLSGVALFSVATGVRVPSRRPATGDRDTDGASREPYDDASIDDIATRLAHLGILHWRVWSQLAYADDVDQMTVDDESMQI
ncbi:camp-mediated signaling sok1 [Trichoderma arundinaceum]|uniref:Camp-mediated signaling sok1 n=1 Tax=Trichoderma arundinaceum TaxID=490622 RepID=A0A395P0B6_TRIAR|nr:camp-mediated signaling sok1 [Trichoderma arundinaceum]